MKLGQDNIFTSVSLSTEGGLPQCMLGCTNPPGRQTPLWQADPPAGRPPGRQTPPLRGRQTPTGRQNPPWQADPPAGRPPARKVNARPVHILLECILVQDGFMTNVRVYYIGIATAL